MINITDIVEPRLSLSWVIAGTFVSTNALVNFNGVLDTAIKIVTLMSLVVVVSYTIYKWIYRHRYNKKNNK